MFGNWLNLPAQVKTLQKRMAEMSEQIAAIVTRLQSSIELAKAEKAQVFVAISGWQDEVSDLRDQVQALQESTPPEFDLSPIIDSINRLDEHIEGVYVPPAQEYSEEILEGDTLEPTFIDPAPIITDDESGVEVGDVPEPPITADEDFPE